MTDKTVIATKLAEVISCRINGLRELQGCDEQAFRIDQLQKDFDRLKEMIQQDTQNMTTMSKEQQIKTTDETWYVHILCCHFEGGSHYELEEFHSEDEAINYGKQIESITPQFKHVIAIYQKYTGRDKIIMNSTDQTIDRYFDLGGNEIQFSDIKNDWSNVGSILRTQTMTVKKYLEMLRHD